MTSMVISYDKGLKTLGLLWNPFQYYLQFIVKDDNESSYKKQTLLSSISKIFDPLVSAYPVTLRAKIIMQQLWTIKIGWDDIIPKEFELEWRSYKKQTNELNNI